LRSIRLHIIAQYRDPNLIPVVIPRMAEKKSEVSNDFEEE
jgi:hypothetical protein